MHSGKVHVVHVVVSLEKGGAEKQLYLLASHPSERCVHSVIAVCREGAWAESLRAAQVPVYCLRLPRAFRWRALWGLAQALRRLRPDVVQCWLPSMNLLGAAAIVLARLGHVRLIASVRNVDDWKPLWRRLAEKIASMRWDAIISNSWAGARQMEADGIGTGKTVVVPNGIELLDAGPSRDAAREALRLGKQEFVVACASRLVAQKRPELVWEAARANPEIRFLMAGSGPLYERLRSDAPANASLLGPVESTRELFAAADVFLSVSEREGTSNSLLEALRAGCAAVVTDAGDSLRVAGEAGVGVTPETLGAVLGELHRNPDRLSACRSAATDRVRCYSVSAMVEASERIYLRLTGRGPTSRVLYLDYTNGIGMGGGQRSLLLILAGVDRTRFSPALACPEGETWLGFTPAGVDVHPLRLPERLRKLSRFGTGWRSALSAIAGSRAVVGKLRRLVRYQAIDILHANNLKMLLLAALANGFGARPIVWHVRDIFPQRAFSKWSLRLGARLATRVIAVSGAVARQFDSPVDVVYNAVRLPDLSRMPELRRAFRAAHGVPDAAFLFGYVGRLDEGKGLDGLLGAFARVARTNSPAWLVIAGEGRCGAALKGLAARLGLDRVVFAGFVREPDSVYAAIDCLLAPSNEPDSFPRTVIEAMSWGRAVIGSESGGIPEAIVHGETGWITRVNDEEGLAGRMTELAGNPERAKQMGRAGREHCAARFSLERQMEHLEAIYEQALEECRG